MKLTKDTLIEGVIVKKGATVHIKEAKNITVVKGRKVKAPPEDLADGVEFYQMVDFEIDYFGRTMTVSHDTKIMTDGRQLVIGGDGFIPDGYEVK